MLELREMPQAKWERPEQAPIRGLRLPLNAWNALRREDIATLDQLRAVADHLETLPGIGPKTAQIIREELARLASCEPDQ
jgi:3-methyladenine DNA glycosylase/8-oxoguanine DNA glycosylase